MVYDTFGLTSNMTDTNGNPYYQGGDFLKEFGSFLISLGRGTSKKNDPAAFGNEVRVYAGNTLTIKPLAGYKITSILINSQAKKPIGSAMAHLSSAVTNATVSCEVGDTVGIVTPINGNNAIVLQPGEQVRITSIEITYEKSAENTGEETPPENDEVTPPDENEPVKSATINTTFNSFDLLTNKVDSDGNPYYQESGFLKSFNCFIIAFGNGISEEDFVAAFGNEIRVYAGNTVTITPVKGYKITSVVINSQAKKPIGSAMAHLASSLDNATTDCAVGDTVGTLTPIDGTKSIVIKPGEQVRITSIQVTYELAPEGEPTLDPTDPSVNESVPSDPTQPAEPSQPADPTQPAEPAPSNPTAVIVIVVIAVVAVAGVAIAAVLKKKRASGDNEGQEPTDSEEQKPADCAEQE